MDKSSDERVSKPKPITSAMWGLIVLFAGFVLLLDNIGIIQPRLTRYFFSWEGVMIISGLLLLVSRGKKWGLLLIGLGSLFMVSRFLGNPVSMGEAFFPLVIIAVGFALILSTRLTWPRRESVKHSANEDVVEDVVIFAASDRVIHSESFRGGKIIAVFGGSKLNLSHTKLAPGVIEIEVICVFGGVQLIVPADWNIKVEVTNILGGYDDKRSPGQVDLNKTVILRGVTIFGGGEVKNYW